MSPRRSRSSAGGIQTSGKCSVTTKNSQPPGIQFVRLVLAAHAALGFQRIHQPGIQPSRFQFIHKPVPAAAGFHGHRRPGFKCCPNNHAIRVFHGLPALVAPPALSHPHLRKRSSAHVRRIRYTFSLLQYLLLCLPHLGRFSPKTAGVTAALSYDPSKTPDF